MRSSRVGAWLSLVLLLAAFFPASPAASAPSGGTVTYLPQIIRDPWQIIVDEGFEHAWPTGLWSVTDPGNEEYYWDRRNCRAATGNYSAWAMGAGSRGSELDCGDNYVDGAYAWMKYGPFSLAGAQQAELRLRAWLNAAAGDDLCLFGSSDGLNYGGYCYVGDTGGVFTADPLVLDLTNVYTIGDLTGDSSVWIAVVFRSNGSGNLAEGAYVDDVLVRRCLTGCPTTSARLTAAGAGQLTSYPAALAAPANLTPAQR